MNKQLKRTYNLNVQTVETLDEIHGLTRIPRSAIIDLAIKEYKSNMDTQKDYLKISINGNGE